MDRKEILSLVGQYFNENMKNKKFTPGKDMVRYAGRVFDEKEMVNLVNSSLDFWLTEGRFAEEFAEKISDFLDIPNIILTNSGSSSNLIAFSALTSKKLGARQMKPGDEVISVAAGFPATVTPVIQNGMIPVFVDVDLKTYNINIDMMKKALSPKTKCVFIAHTLGNPFNLDEVAAFCKKNNLWLIEDNCDAFGSRYDGQYTGTFGDISTISFYPAHHITTGEGGAVAVRDEELTKIIKSFRDWGRDCYCNSGENNTCGKRFSQQFGTLPLGYDHKYVYSEIGYNLKMTDMQASIGCAQMDKLEDFCNKRRENFKKYTKIFSKYEKYFILEEATPKSDPSWFAYVVTLNDKAPFKRDDLVRFINENLIETRYLFAGNMIRQPFFDGVKYRLADHLNNTDYIMNNTFFLGTYPGLTQEMMDYIESVIDTFMKKY
jgi:CDP-4-dehydro-6-deoxyglucose reductase, E1